MRKITTQVLCIILLTALAGAAIALPMPRGKVASITLDGVLKVEIPKPEEKKPKQIKINVG